MLRITKVETTTEQRWILDGQLTGPWVAELRLTWENARSTCQGRRCVVDLSDVTFIDERGERILRAMRHQGVQFIARGVDTKQLLEDLGNNRQRPLRKCIAYLGDQANHDRDH